MSGQGAPQRQRGAHVALCRQPLEGGLCSTPLQKYIREQL